MSVPEVVQPDLRQLVLPHRPACPHDLLDEPARVPLGMPVDAVEVPEDERGVPHELEREQASGRPVGACRSVYRAWNRTRADVDPLRQLHATIGGYVAAGR